MSRPPVDLLRTSDAARALNVSPRTIIKWLEAGKLRGGRLPGGHWRVPAAEIARVRVELGIDGDESRWEPTARDEHYPGAGRS